MKSIAPKSKQRSWLTLALLAAATVWGTAPMGAQVSIDLIGFRWEQPTVTYWINNVNGRASAAAVADVQTAINDWNKALERVRACEPNGPCAPDAPALQLASSLNQAEIRINLYVPRTGPFANVNYDNAYFSFQFENNCVFVSAGITMSSKFLASKPPLAKTRNVARHLLGEALGLGDITCSTDVMHYAWIHTSDDIAIWDDVPHVDLGISPCDRAGLAAIYAAPSCADIPASITCTCP